MKTIIELREEAIKEDKNPEFYLYQKLEEKDKEIERLNNIIYKLDSCIKDFLCTEEYIIGDMEAISNNYVKLLNIIDEQKEGK